MQSRLPCGIIVLLAAIASFEASTARAVEMDTPTAIMARQKIRTELAEAMSDGRLTRNEQYSILLDAKDSLPAEDMAGLQRSLNRLASNQKAAAPGGVSRQRGDGETTAVQYQEIEEGGNQAGPFVEEGTPGEMVQTDPESDMGCDGCDGCEFPSDPFACDGKTAAAMMCSLGHTSCANLQFLTAIDSFKGPMDLVFSDIDGRNGNNNGNFGVRFGLNGAIPIVPQMGLGLEAGTNEIISDFSGAMFSASRVRNQNFSSVGVFKRIPTCSGNVAFGFTHDWLFDHYHSSYTFGQWRIKAAWEMNPCNEIGIWTAIRDKGDEGFVTEDGESFLEVHYRPINQGNFYWRHTWCNDASLTGKLGLADDPGTVVLGAEGKVPLSDRLAMMGNFTYVPPMDRGGPLGQSEEFWNISVGLEFVPGGIRRSCRSNLFTPLLGAPDNGSFLVREVF